MKKKFLVTLMVVCVLLPVALSAAVVDLSIGATAQYSDTFDQIKQSIDNDDFDGFTDISNYNFGADVRVKFLIAEVDVVGMFGTDTIDSVDYTTISALTTAGISMDLLGLARLGFGMGPRYSVLIDDDGNTKVLDNNGAAVTTENFLDTFVQSPVSYRATLDFNLGSIMLGVNYTVDSEYTFKNYAEVDKLFSAPFGDGKLGLSVLFSLF